MSRQPTGLPERLIAGEATDFERRVIESALEQRPSAAASARMARALGVTVTTLGTAATAKAIAANALSKAPSAAASTASTIWPWLSVGVVGLVVVGAVAGLRAHRATAPSLGSPATLPSVTAPVSPVPSPRAAPQLESRPPSLTSNAQKPARAGHAVTASSELREEIAMLDTARAALSAGNGRGALDIVRRYEAKYTSGSFRPEATAIKIEALLNVGREGEARNLARRFVADQRGTLLARRVAERVGLTESATSASDRDHGRHGQ